jgi:hypothetical protein
MSEEKKLRIALISLHGLIRGENLNWGGTKTPAGRPAMCWNWPGPFRRTHRSNGWT